LLDTTCTGYAAKSRHEEGEPLFYVVQSPVANTKNGESLTERGNSFFCGEESPRFIGRDLAFRRPANPGPLPW